MKSLFKIIFFLFFFFCFPANVHAETAQPAVDLNVPAPESPIQLRIPHSERTKDNVLDIVLDFLMTTFFKKIKNVRISYGFFEIDQNRDLNFTDVTAKITRSDVQGSVFIPKVKVDLSEFFSFLKGKQVVFSEVSLTDVAADVTLIKKEKEGEKKRILKATAKEMLLKKVFVASLQPEESRKKQQDITMGGAFVKKASLSVSDPDEKYAVSQAQMKEIVLPNKALDDFTFSSVTVDGQTYADRNAFIKAIKQ